MSTSISTSFIRDYEADLNHVFQRRGGKLRATVRTKDNIVGSSTTFQKIGKGVATTKARHGVITPMNQDHTAIQCSLSDFYAGDWVDKLDEAKTNIDERMAIAQGGAWALGRKVDDQILTALDATTQSSKTITVSSKAALEGTMLEWVDLLFANDVPDDGDACGVISTRLYAMLMTLDGFSSADFVDVKPMEDGIPVSRARVWAGVKWMTHTGLTNVGAASCKGFLYHKSAVGYATGAHSENKAQDAGESVSADITWHGDRAAHFVNHYMSGGGCLIDDTGVIEGTWDDSASVPTS